MLGEALRLLDADAFAVVVLGTILATIARCGWGEISAALGALSRLGSPGFDEGANRAALAKSAAVIHQKGHLAAIAPVLPDRISAKLVQGFLINGSIESLRRSALANREERESARERARRPFEYAGELAPVFGLVGTLFAITQLNPSADIGITQSTMASLATAVLSTLYGVLTAHLFYLPISRAIERRGEKEEQARAQLLDWFEAEMAGRHDLRRGSLRGVA